ncbi:zinc finger protein 616-like isoform X2 [Pteropus medius]|uniref:zinc finger protein 616-like isoform X2 n=1 Tax=Pteropus vampyrus TaxID=132908 RepID=UPI00196AA0A8|nr:zinc finger protein 616-like isoform X2 [Pteropus giganteus]
MESGPVLWLEGEGQSSLDSAAAAEHAAPQIDLSRLIIPEKETQRKKKEKGARNDYITDITARCMIKELSPKEAINKGELFQALMMDKHKSYDIKDFNFRKLAKYA